MSNEQSDYIMYIGGGLLGDFIQQLSVVKELFEINGKKGIVYMSNSVGDMFRNSIEQTHQELKDLLTQKDGEYPEYIQDLRIYKGENVHINLSQWRKSNLLYKSNWQKIFHSVYDVSWGSKKWINVSSTLEHLQDKILINYSSTRSYHGGLTFTEDEKTRLIFVGFSENDYKLFKKLSGLDVPFYKAADLYDLSVVINSCSLFIGGLSSPLALCLAMHKKCIAHFKNDIDGVHMTGISDHLPFVTEIKI